MPRTLDLSAVLSLVLVAGCTRPKRTAYRDFGPAKPTYPVPTSILVMSPGVKMPSRQVIRTNLGDLPMELTKSLWSKTGCKDSFVLA